MPDWLGGSEKNGFAGNTCLVLVVVLGEVAPLQSANRISGFSFHCQRIIDVCWWFRDISGLVIYHHGSIKYIVKYT